MWDVAVRFRGSLITFHWSCLPDACRLGSISHNQDKMLNTPGNKWGVARNGIGKMPTSCWKLNISCWIFCVQIHAYKWELVFPSVTETLKISFTIALYCLNIFLLTYSLHSKSIRFIFLGRSSCASIILLSYLLLLSHVTFNVKYKWIMDHNNKSHSDTTDIIPFPVCVKKLPFGILTARTFFISLLDYIFLGQRGRGLKANCCKFTFIGLDCGWHLTPESPLIPFPPILAYNLHFTSYHNDI